MRSDAPKTIVVGVDGSEQSRRAVMWAAEEARRTGGAVEAVHAWIVVIGTPVVGQMAYNAEDAEALAERFLDEAIGPVDEASLVAPIRRVVTEGRATCVLEKRAATADLLVVGTRGRGGFRCLLLGSVAEDLLHRSPCPLVLVPPSAPEPSGATTVGVDGSEESIAALRWATSRRTAGARPIVVLYAVNFHDVPASTTSVTRCFEDGARSWLRGLIAGSGINPSAVTIEVVDDSPSHALVERSRQGDIVVVGYRGAGRVRSILAGSVTRHLAHHGASPVVVHRMETAP